MRVQLACRILLFASGHDLNGASQIDGSQRRERLDAPDHQAEAQGTDIPADFHYYNRVDQHNIIRTRKGYALRCRIEFRRADALNPQTKQWTTSASRTRWDSTRVAWMAASTIPTMKGPGFIPTMGRTVLAHGRRQGS